MKDRYVNLLITLALIFFCSTAWALERFVLPTDGSDLIGEIRYTTAGKEDTLIEIARTFSIGQDEIVSANPNVDRWLPAEGAAILLPTLYILPDAPRNGIVLNIPEMRLYYFPPVVDENPADVITYPVSIGRMNWKTPLGTTRVVQKVVNPSWVPPASIRKEHAAEGDVLPAVVPPGPENPLGRLALKLGVPGYLIHGTDEDKALGVGMRVTHGCIRMYNENIEELFPMVRVGTRVHIVNQPVKVGWSSGTLYIEVSPPIDEDRLDDKVLLNKAFELIHKKTNSREVYLDEAAIRRAVQEKRGIPMPISTATPPVNSYTDKAVYP